MAIATRVPFRSIPGCSRLFLEYVEMGSAALEFYQHRPTADHVRQLSNIRPAQFPFSRKDLTAILRRQNTLLGADPSTSNSIDELERGDCAAIVTGQQVGLFGGPLYTVYKAMTALRLAEELRAKGARAVAVFWMECEDHDLDEVTHLTLLGPEGAGLRRMEFAGRLFGEEREKARPVGSLSLNEAIQPALAEFLGQLPPGPGTERIRASLESAYAPGAGLAEAFGRLMARLFTGRGLIFFNPTDPEAKRLAAPLFQKAVRAAGEIHDCLLERTRRIEAAGFEVQVGIPANATVLFLNEKGERRALIRQGDRFALKNSEMSWSSEELLQVAETEPWRFSPNVLLRPIMQDYLFPTAAYVGGPAEIAYSAQVETLCRLLGRPMPVIWPRASFTLIEPEISVELEASGLTFRDCLKGRPHLLEKIVGSAQLLSSGGRLRLLAEEIAQTCQDIRPAMMSADSSLGPALDTALRKILHNLESLKGKFVQLEERRNSAFAIRADRILSSCYPNQVLQEREFNISGYLARHGPSVLSRLYEQVDLNAFDHRVIVLESPSSGGDLGW